MLVLKILSFAGLILTVIPSFFVFAGIISLEVNKNLMIIGTILWFATSPFWINKEKTNGVQENA
ncbi:MAG: hypothetical protein H0Z29_00785 [Candidatus Marinimicrobia bacterium]|nr:hypothetical protein [Candidatus Neomarinimicrobiota bacterium]